MSCVNNTKQSIGRTGIFGKLGENTGRVSFYSCHIFVARNPVKLNRQEATEAANKATTAFNRVIIFSIIAICVALAITVFQAISINNKTVEYLKEYDNRQKEAYNKLMIQESGVLDLKEQI